MSATSTMIVMPCDICQEEMRETDTGMVCWRGSCRNLIPYHELHRYEGVRIVKTAEANNGN